VNGDGRVDQVAAQRPEPGERAILVSRGQTAESNHISGEDRSDLPRFSHGFASGFGDAIMNDASAPVGRTSGAEKHFGQRPSDKRINRGVARLAAAKTALAMEYGAELLGIDRR
jgi:hypothetical protein